THKPVSRSLHPPVVPHPANSTLHPYTTLFRSVREACERGQRLELAVRLDPAPHVRACHPLPRLEPRQHVEVPQREELERQVEHPDRKSTRLNSSHVKISYAVFCLKKKIQNHAG